MDLLRVVNKSSSSVQLSLNTSADTYNVTCQSSIDGNGSLNHLVTLLDVMVKEFTVKPLAPSTKYICCLEQNKMMINESCSEDFLTKPLAPGTTPELALEEAGAIGGAVGIVVTLFLIAVITSIAIGIAIRVRKKRAIIRSQNRPVLRTNSKIYRKPNSQKEPEMSEASIVENNLKPPSLPTSKPSRQGKQQQPNPHRLNKGALAPPTRPCQGNVYTSQKRADVEVSDSFEDYDDDEFAEPEETYETMLSTADNVAYKNTPRVAAQRTRKTQRKQAPEECYDYLQS